MKSAGGAAGRDVMTQRWKETICSLFSPRCVSVCVHMTHMQFVSVMCVQMFLKYLTHFTFVDFNLPHVIYEESAVSAKFLHYHFLYLPISLIVKNVLHVFPNSDLKRIKTIIFQNSLLWK